MHEANFIVREPLLDPKQRVIGYRLGWQPAEAGVADAADGNALMVFAAAQLNDPESGWLLGDCVLFMEADPALLSDPVLQAMLPKNTIISLAATDVASADTRAILKTVHEQGYGISLRKIDLAAPDQALLPLVSHIEVERGAMDFATQAKLFGAFKPPSVRMLARRVESWQDYNCCAALGLDACVGQIYLSPRPGTQAKGMNASQAVIVQLMELVRKNADVRELEGVLKRDASLSYKLFRYINSVGFGLGAEINSLRHAVTMLGYSTLYRWLSLLLATASSGGHAAVLMQTAIIRGRFVELLGHGLLTKNEVADLFVTGMFSLLDRLLGMPMEKLLEHIQLPEPIAQALLAREGMYGPFLALAEACDSNHGHAEELADSLFISPKRVNEAHLAALVWAQNLKI